MRLSAVFILLMLFQANSFAQSFSISADKMNIVYIGIDNPISIVSDNCSCKDLFATTDNGTLTKKDNCHFSYMPTKTGNTTIVIQKKQNGKLVKIDEQVLQCKYIPDPRVAVGNKSGGTFSLEQLKLQEGINVVFDQGFEMDLKFVVTSFRVGIFHYPCGEYFETIVGNRFTDKTLAQFKLLKPGASVFFENIKLKFPDNSIRPMNPMAFKIR